LIASSPLNDEDHADDEWNEVEEFIATVDIRAEEPFLMQ